MIHARNAGFESAEHPLIARCDADAVLPPNWISRIRQHFIESKHIDALSGPTFYYDLPLKSPLPVNAYLGAIKIFQKGQETMYGPNMALRKSIWSKVRNHVTLKDNLVHEDVDLGIHILRAGGYIHCDRKLVSSVSARRIKSNPVSFFY